MTKCISAGLILAALALTSCGSSEQPGVDHVFYNANVYTVNDSNPSAQAVAVSGNEIVYVGNDAGAMELVGSNTAQHDLGGQMLLPGFIDSHMHPIMGGQYAQALSLETGGTVDEWIAAIADYAAANPDAPVLFGYGWLATTFGPEGPQKELIDEVAGDRPVLLMDEGFHAAWANSKTLELLNITQDTPDPEPGFSYYKRDENGEATGYLLEGTGVAAMEQLDVVTEQTITDGTAIVIDALNAYGVTAVFDAGAFGHEQRLNTILGGLENAGELTLRVVGAYAVAEAGAAEDAVENALETKRSVVGDNYHYRMLKIMDDGTVEGRTAAMFEDYQGEPGNSGETVFSQEVLTQMVVDATAAKLDVHIHALGERAIHETLNAIETARQVHPETDSRYAICHIQIMTDQDLPRFAELDVIAQSSPLWASYDTYGKQFVSDDQFERSWRYNSLKESGARLTWGSDFPASGAGMLGMSPVLQMEIGHTRQYPGEPDAPIQPRESERVDIETLIRGYTIDAAYQLRMEDEIGSIEVGKKADLVVLDQNLFEVDAYAIHQTNVILTVFDGEIVYTAEP